MSTLSIPLPDEMVNQIKSLIKQGAASNMSDFVRKALQQYLEEQAVQTILKADKEPNLKGDIDELAKKL